MRIKAPLREVGNARRKMKAEQIRQREDMIADAAAVGVVGRDAQVSLLVEQSVDDISGFAGRRDRNRVVGSLAGREVRVENRGSSALVMSVDRPACFSGTGSGEVLPVPARHIGCAE